MNFKGRNDAFRLLNTTLQVKFVGLAVLAIAALCVGTPAASPGALDLSFANRGTMALGIQTRNKENRAVAIQPDGKIVLAGYYADCTGIVCDADFAIIRLNTNGTLDTTFGTNGIVFTDFFEQNESANAVAIQADGKIVAAGGFQGGDGGGQNIFGFKLVRYMPDGTLDTSFGTAGRVYESFDDVGGNAQTMIIQPDGKIVVAGTDDNSMLFIARFNPNGGLDTGFNTDGRFTGSLNATEARLALQTNGKILVVTNGSSGTINLVRFNSDGTFDSTFGSGGATSSAFSGSFKPTVAIQSDGKVIVSGDYYNQDFRIPPLRRFNTDGSVDAGFVPNHGDATSNACVNCTQDVVKVLVLPDGRFYLVGFYSESNGVPTFFTVSRYLSSGTIDSSFGFRGTSRFRHTNLPRNSDSSLSRVNDAALQADGKVVIAATGRVPFANLTFGQSAFLAVRINAAVTPPSMRGDFDGDRRTDFAVFRPSNRFWYVLNSSNGSTTAERYGADGDLILPGDYNYDLKTDLAVFRLSTNNWYISSSQPSGGGTAGGLFGEPGDINIPEDYDGDGYTDLALFRPSNGTWYFRYSSRWLFGFSQASPLTPLVATFPFGTATDIPVPADYDGDGRADIAVFRPSTGYWYIMRSSDSVVTSTLFGISTDKTVQGDYDGDLKADIAVFRDGNWYILRSSDNGFVGVTWGFGTDKPVPGDYDGDGKFDVAVFRPSDGAWYALKSSDSAVIGQQWGIAEDTPIPFVFVR